MRVGERSCVIRMSGLAEMLLVSETWDLQHGSRWVRETLAQVRPHTIGVPEWAVS